MERCLEGAAGTGVRTEGEKESFEGVRRTGGANWGAEEIGGRGDRNRAERLDCGKGRKRGSR